MMDYQVVICGAGPIGLLLGNLLAKENIKTLIIEKKLESDQHSKAIGITPPSLGILKKIKLDNLFIQQGVKINQVWIHGSKYQLGSLTFRNIKSEFQFILSLPQIQTEKNLEDHLRNQGNIKILRNSELIDITPMDQGIEITIIDHNHSQTQHLKTSYLVACDGGKSSVRNLLKIVNPGNPYQDTFLMGDFFDSTSFQQEAHLFFTSLGSVESFPLPAGKRRWIIQTDQYRTENDLQDHFLIDEIQKRTNIRLNPSDQMNENPFGVQHYLNSNYFKDRVIFCGDSAHTMSPIGGQGMNTGFADADLLAMILSYFLKESSYQPQLLKRYEKYRKKAAQAATFRAWSSMRIGTVKGKFQSFFRNLLLFAVLNLPLKAILPAYFSMINIPFGQSDLLLQKDLLLKNLIE
ncbi:MAG: FAD-dependent monooxygenase [Spirochaetes bacterium]|nr:FAD-dependent monooxygenase [Spirochaetota bacterium]